MKRIFILTALLAGAFTGAYAQTGQPLNLSLQECIDYALLHQDTVLNAQLDVKSAEYKVKETTGQGLPQVSGSAQFQDYIKIPQTLIPAEIFGGTPGTYVPLQFGVKYQSTLGLNVSQLIFDESYFVGLKASRTYKELYQRSFTRSKINATINVTKAYYQVLVSNEQLKLLDADLKQLKEQVDQTAAQNKQGFAEQIDVQRIQVQYNNLVTNRENIVRSLVLNYELLKFQMGMPVGDQLLLKDKLEDVSLTDENAAQTSDTTFYHNRIEYGLLETNYKLNQLQVANVKSRFYPTLSFQGNYVSSYQNNSFDKLFQSNFPSSYIGLTLNVPIFSGGQRINQYRQAKIAVLKSENDMAHIKNGIILQADAARTTYINSLKSLNNQKENQKLAREVLRVSKIKYQQGVGSSIEVTQAQTALEQSDNDYVQALYNALVSKVDLQNAYGQIK